MNTTYRLYYLVSSRGQIVLERRMIPGKDTGTIEYWAPGTQHWVVRFWLVAPIRNV